MKKKMLFVYNPHAGKGRIRQSLSKIIELYVKNEYEVVTYSTLGEKDARNIVIDCLGRDEYDIIVCSGGDGTLNEVIGGLVAVDKKIRIGYIPAGTTNDFAYSLGLPKNMLKAAQQIITGQSFLCDIGSLNGEHFVYTAAFGIFTDTSYCTPQTSKNMLGRLAYVLEGIKRLPNWKSYHMIITCKNRVIKDNFIYGMVANSNSIGGFKGITGKDVLLDDGIFEGVFIKVPQNVIGLQAIINDLLRGNIKSNHIFFLPVQKLQITSDEVIPWTVDGEFGGKYKNVTIKNINKGVEIICNKKTK